MSTEKREATLVSYKVIFDSKGNLVTERTSSDIESIKHLFTKRDYHLLKSIIREAKANLDDVHKNIEIALNARKEYV
tara:strand:+ start:6321 stop:6551 length:231 start_codon:yes stop_codon:yes gene_type:complete